MWKWLRDGSNQKLIALLGSGFAAIVVAIWSIYTYFYPASKLSDAKSASTVVEARCGIAAGNDIISGNVAITCGLDQREIGILIAEKLSELDLDRLIDEANAATPEVKSQLSELSSALGVTEDHLRTILT